MPKRLFPNNFKTGGDAIKQSIEHLQKAKIGPMLVISGQYKVSTIKLCFQTATGSSL
jgi:hypothetical protein